MMNMKSRPAHVKNAYHFHKPSLVIWLRLLEEFCTRLISGKIHGNCEPQHTSSRGPPAMPTLLLLRGEVVQRIWDLAKNKNR